MRVYRCITLQEVIDKYRNTETYCFFNHTSNTHNYDEGKKYIHFFRYYEFAKYYFDLGHDENYEKKHSHYILFMTVNIPDEILEKFKGFGFYMLDGEKIPVPEYAIPVEDFSSDYIVDITDKPVEMGYIRVNEREEYDKYIQVVNGFIQSNQKMDYIVDVLMQSNFEKLLGIHIDTRTEEEMKKTADLLLSTIHMPISNDDEIEEIGGMNDETLQKR